MVRAAIREVAGAATGGRPCAPGGPLGAVLPCPVAPRPALLTEAWRVVEVVPRPQVLAAPITRLPVLVIAVVAPLATTTQVAPSAVAHAQAVVAASSATSLTLLVATPIGRLRLPSAREGAVAPLLAVEATEAEVGRTGAA